MGKNLTPEWPRQIYGKVKHESNPCVSSVAIEWQKHTKVEFIGYVEDPANCQVTPDQMRAVIQEHYMTPQLDPDEVKLLKRTGIGMGTDVSATIFCLGKGFKEGNSLLGAAPSTTALLTAIAVPYALFYVVARDTPPYRSLALDKSYNAVAGIRFAAGVRNLIICT